MGAFLSPHLTYVGLMVFTISFPLTNSFEHRIQYHKTWKHLWVGTPFTAAFFIAWDAFFTKIGVWAFNPNYVVGIYSLGLPIEEWSFFFCVPFACVFIYECVGYYFKPTVGQSWSHYFFWVLLIGLAAVSISNLDKWYTSVKLGSTVVALAIHYVLFKTKYLGKFFVAYFFTLIPFLLVNGVLTWLPVVTYNNNENLGIRIKDLVGLPFFNIPIEDSVYSMLLLLMNISFLEFFRSKTVSQKKQL